MFSIPIYRYFFLVSMMVFDIDVIFSIYRCLKTSMFSFDVPSLECGPSSILWFHARNKLREPLVSDWSQEWSQPIWSVMANARCVRRLSTSFRQLRSWAFRLVCLCCNRQLCDMKKSFKKMFVDNSDITKRDAGYVWESNLVIFGKFTFERVECKSIWFDSRPHNPTILLPTNVSYVTNFPLKGLQKIVYDTRVS